MNDLGGSLASGQRSPRATLLSGPCKLYVPRTRSEVVAAVQETQSLGQRLWVCRPGDREEESAPRGQILLSLERVDRIIALDPRAHTVTVESGVLMGTLTSYLAKQGFALRVWAEESARSLVSFLALGGVGAGSHEFGSLLASVRSCELVMPDGEVRTLQRAEGPEFAGLLRGDAAVLTKLTLDVVPQPAGEGRLSCNVRATSTAAFLALSAEHLRSEQHALCKYARLIEHTQGAHTLGRGVLVSCYEKPRSALQVGLGAWERACQRFARVMQPGGRTSPPDALTLPRAGVRQLRRAVFECERERELRTGPARVYRLRVRETRYESLFSAVQERARAQLANGRLAGFAIDVLGVRAARIHSVRDQAQCELRITLCGGPHESHGSELAAWVAALDRVCRGFGAERVLLSAPAPTIALASGVVLS